MRVAVLYSSCTCVESRPILRTCSSEQNVHAGPTATQRCNCEESATLFRTQERRRLSDEAKEGSAMMKTASRHLEACAIALPSSSSDLVPTDPLYLRLRACAPALPCVRARVCVRIHISVVERERRRRERLGAARGQTHT